MKIRQRRLTKNKAVRETNRNTRYDDNYDFLKKGSYTECTFQHISIEAKRKLSSDTRSLRNILPVCDVTRKFQIRKLLFFFFFFRTTMLHLHVQLTPTGKISYQHFFHNENNIALSFTSSSLGWVVIFRYIPFSDNPNFSIFFHRYSGVFFLDISDMFHIFETPWGVRGASREGGFN